MPVVTTRRARALAAAIRNLRERSRMTSRELSAQLGHSHSTVSHWETGKRIPTPEDVASLLGAVGVSGEERERILNMARHAAEPNWLTVGMPGVPEQLAGAVECERDADRITEWAPSILPGLLQTSGYARAVISANGLMSPGEVESRVLIRMGRRDILSDGQPRSMLALIGETALRHRIASNEATLEQLRHLHSLCGGSGLVEIRVVPTGDGWHPGLHGSFVFYDFPDSEPVVHFEHYSSGAFIQDEKDVTAYRHAIKWITEVALTEDESSNFLAELISEMEQQP